MLRLPSIATSGTDSYNVDWTARLPSGATLSSVAYTADPTGEISISGASVASNVATFSVTAGTVEREYFIKMVPTLSAGSISPVSVRIKVVKHKEPV